MSLSRKFISNVALNGCIIRANRRCTLDNVIKFYDLHYELHYKNHEGFSFPRQIRKWGGGYKLELRSWVNTGLNLEPTLLFAKDIGCGFTPRGEELLEPRGKPKDTWKRHDKRAQRGLKGLWDKAFSFEVYANYSETLQSIRSMSAMIKSAGARPYSLDGCPIYWLEDRVGQMYRLVIPNNTAFNGLTDSDEVQDAHVAKLLDFASDLGCVSLTSRDSPVDVNVLYRKPDKLIYQVDNDSYDPGLADADLAMKLEDKAPV